MAALLTPDGIDRELADVPEWRRSGGALRVRFRLASFPVAIDLVRAVADLAQAADHHPDIDIRYDRVTFVLTTHSAGGITGADVRLAHGISAAASSRGGEPVESG
jgi:4a-hydroxytetrahydrobiopterin dehydratase